MLTGSRKKFSFLVAAALCLQGISAMAQQPAAPAVKQFTVQEAVDYALANYPAQSATTIDGGSAALFGLPFMIAGVFIGLENYQWLWDDSIFWLSVFNTLLYTIVASAIKFAIGLYLALLLNRNMPFKALIRSIVLIPFIVPTVLSAIAFWWIYDSQFSIISWSLIKLGLIDHNIDFLGDSNMARGSVIFANIWRGVPFVAITLLAGLQTVSPSLYEAAVLDGATNWQRFRYITYPLLTPIIAVVMTFSVLFTFTDFQLIWALTRGGPVNATHLMATLSYQRGIISGRLGEGAAIATAMIPFLLAAIAISWFGMQRRKWQQGSNND